MVPRTWNCAVCQAVVSGSSLCGSCRKVAYCGEEHQAQDRAAHQPHCFFPFIQKGGMETTQVLQFDISLLPGEIKPRIWRRIQVPKNFNFAQFHKAIQIAFEWHSIHHSYHLHQFLFGRNIVIGVKEDGYDDGFATILDQKKKFLKDHFEGPPVGGPNWTYEYDFGDSWEHKIKYEGEFPAEPDVVYPRCLAGKRAGVPEDAGNSPGYYRICEILKNPQHKEYKETVEWLESQGKPNYNPANFKPSDIVFA